MYWVMESFYCCSLEFSVPYKKHCQTLLNIIFQVKTQHLASKASTKDLIYNCIYIPLKLLHT